MPVILKWNNTWQLEVLVDKHSILSAQHKFLNIKPKQIFKNCLNH